MWFIIDIVALAVIALFAFWGYKKGFVGSLLGLASSVICIPLSLYLANAIGTDNPLSVCFWFVALFLLFKFSFSVLGFFLKIIEKIPIIKTLNATGGAIIGFINGIVLAGFACFGFMLLLFFKDNTLYDSVTDNSYICNFLISIISKLFLLF